MSDDASAEALRSLREHPYEMSPRVINELLALNPEARQEYLAEQQAMYCEESRGECLLKLAANQGQSELAYDFVNKVGFEIKKTQDNDYNLVTCISRGCVELVELFASKIGIGRDCLKAWMTLESESESETDVKEILEILMKYGLRFDCTNSRILYDSMPNSFNPISFQTKLLFEKGVEYKNDDLNACALRKAAIWGKVAAVDLFLTGSSHTPEEAASAYELLQIGVMRPKKLEIPLNSEGLKYFRRAQAIRDAANLTERVLKPNRKCFSSVAEIVELENQINQNKALEFVSQCYAICTAHDFSSEPYSDPLGIYDLQTWMFFHLDSYQDILSLYLHTDLEPRRFFHNKYKSAIARLLIECRPATWQQYIMIFHTLKSMTYQSNTAVDILRAIDLDGLTAALQSPDFPRAGYSLMLSYVVDIMQFIVVEVLLEYVALLLDLGASVSVTSEEYRELETQMEKSTSHEMWWLPPEEVGIEHGNMTFHHTTMHRLLCTNSMWMQSNRYKLLVGKVVEASCCQLDAGHLSQVKRRHFGVLQLKCFAAKKCPRSCSHRLPSSLALFMKKHR